MSDEVDRCYVVTMPERLYLLDSRGLGSHCFDPDGFESAVRSLVGDVA